MTCDHEEAFLRWVVEEWALRESTWTETDIRHFLSRLTPGFLDTSSAW
jgi:hypothetical protein